MLAWGVRFRQLQRLTATPLERWPSVALIVPCYLPNEEAIVMETVTPCGGCNPMRWRLQPHAEEAAAPCGGGCNPMRRRL